MHVGHHFEVHPDIWKPALSELTSRAPLCSWVSILRMVYIIPRL